MAPGLVRIFRDIPGFGSTAAGDAAVRVAPEDYIKASGEILFLTIVVSWIIAGIWNADTIERNALKDRIGYNNVCVAWDEPPALYPAAFMMQFAIYCAVRGSVLDLVRAAKTPALSAHGLRSVRVCNVCYAVSMMAMSLIFVVTPAVSPEWHSAVFGQYIFFRFIVVAGNYFESADIGADISTRSWVFLAVYGVISLAMITCVFVNLTNYAEVGGPTVPVWFAATVDYAWFICLAATSVFLPNLPPLQISYGTGRGPKGKQSPAPTSKTTSSAPSRSGQVYPSV